MAGSSDHFNALQFWGKDFYAVIPPLSLGSSPGPDLSKGFFVGFTMAFLVQDRDQVTNKVIEFNPQDVLLTLPDGRKIRPEKATTQFQNCEIASSDDSDFVWKGSGQKHVGRNHIGGALFFRIKPPAVEERFSIALGSVRWGDADVPVPEVFFDKGSAWGGW